MLTEKKMNKIQKALGADTIQELDASDTNTLSGKITLAESAVKVAEDELEANPKFQSLKEDLKALSEGMREVKKRQRAITLYCLHLLEEKGGAQ